MRYEGKKNMLQELVGQVVYTRICPGDDTTYVILEDL